MILASKKQKQVIAILTKNDKRYKSELVISETKDPKRNSTNDLTHAQANHIISMLGGRPLKYDNWAYYDKTKQSHLYILSLSIQFGWFIVDERYGEIADLQKLSEWLKSDKSPVKMPIKEMAPEQISKVIFALESMVDNKYK